MDTSTVRGIYGPFAALVWISLAETPERADAADAAMSDDPTHLERIEKAASCSCRVQRPSSSFGDWRRVAVGATVSLTLLRHEGDESPLKGGCENAG